jgi:hypothetical protein
VLPFQVIGYGAGVFAHGVPNKMRLTYDNMVLTRRLLPDLLRPRICRLRVLECCSPSTRYQTCFGRPRI